jgi:hypothetical protein
MLGRQRTRTDRRRGEEMAFIEIFWATYAPYSLLIAHLKAGLPGVIYGVRPGSRAGQASPRGATAAKSGINGKSDKSR